MDNFSEERIARYPYTWEDEYRQTGFVQLWRDDYPDLFKDYEGSTLLGTLDLFPQYALMYLLRIGNEIRSITWYKLASPPELSKNNKRTLKHWAIMQRWVGQENYKSLQNMLYKKGFKGFTGEPDLFCWDIHIAKSDSSPRQKVGID